MDKREIIEGLKMVENNMVIISNITHTRGFDVDKVVKAIPAAIAALEGEEREEPIKKLDLDKDWEKKGIVNISSIQNKLNETIIRLNSLTERVEKLEGKK